MYYCYRSKSKEYSLEKIHERQKILREKLLTVTIPQSPDEGDNINDLNLWHPAAELMIEFRVLMFWVANPPDPRGEKMCCRVPPYFIHVSTKELALAIGKHYKTVERAKKLIHEKLDLKERADVTVDEFCNMLNYTQDDIDKIHQNLEYIRQGKWKKIRDMYKKKDDE